MIGMTACSGIGSFKVAAPWIDWRYQSEIKPFPCAVLAHRFPAASGCTPCGRPAPSERGRVKVTGQSC